LNVGIKRKETRPVNLGGVQIGGGAPVVVQSMTCTDTRDVKSTVKQIKKLEDAGCEVVRVAVASRDAASALKNIKKKIKIPLIADIHFSDRLAIDAIEAGADGIRINPGNLPPEKIKKITKAAKSNNVVIRIGINSGSLEKDILMKYGKPSAEALVESATKNISLLEDLGFTAIKVSLKSSDVITTIKAYQMISRKMDYPLHLGLTEAGSVINAAIKSSISLGILLCDGIGDTIRVSVTGDPLLELPIAYGILRALNIRRVGPDIISCPTCGRCEVDLLKLSKEVERKLSGIRDYFKVAIMGCVVNGPGEAAEADIGIAGGKGMGFLFKKGKRIKKIREDEFIPALLDEIHLMIENKEK
jgi:(E)-4-hydroxy-3-methylbut-2-enyl-diphosphate synthase